MNARPQPLSVVKLNASEPALALPTQALDFVAIALLLVATGIAFVTFRDFGLGWDDYAHSEYGDLLLAYYGSAFHDQRALSFVNLYEYGGGFDMFAALVAKVLPFTLFETRRLVGALVGIVGMIAVWRTARHVGGPLAGLIALVLIATCPLYVGHMFINAKDAPFAVAMAILLLGLVHAFADYPRLTISTGVIVALGFGLSIGSRILGGFGVIELLGGLALLFAIDVRAVGLQIAAARLGRFILALLPAAVLAYAIMAVIWPWSISDPLNPLRAVAYFSHFFEKPWSELFTGQPVLVTDMPRSYVPTLLALKLPEIFTLLGVAGAVCALFAVFRPNASPQRRAVFLVVALAAILPIAVTVMTRPAMYNGVRHFVFVLPPFAVLGGLAGAWLIELSASRGRALAVTTAAVIMAGAALPIADMVRTHPYEYTSFNHAAGGVAGARRQFMLDYWGLALKQASQGLAAKLTELHLTKPPGRRWKLAVCGPHRSPQVELGPDFETTWEPKDADFAMMLGEFYCAHFDAPLWVDVVRAGVSYARVYDIRGRAYPTLLTLPGL
jgi:hypothetical protein